MDSLPLGQPHKITQINIDTNSFLELSEVFTYLSERGIYVGQIITRLGQNIYRINKNPNKVCIRLPSNVQVEVVRI